MGGAREKEEGGLDYEGKVLSQFCHAQQHLVVTYTKLSSLNSAGVVTIDEDVAGEVGAPKDLC